MKKVIRYLLILSILSLVSCAPSFAATASVNSSGVSPLTYSNLNFYNKNGIYYYNPQGAEYCTIGVGSYDGSTTAGLYPSQASFVDMYHDIAIQLSVEYGIPWEAVMAQGILESASGTSNFAIYRNNFFGIGAVDSNPDNARYFETPMAGWRGYYDFIKNNSRYKNHGAFSEPNITNPYSYIQAIKNAGYATDPNYVSKVSRLIAAIIHRATEKGWPTSAELAQMYPEMLSNAALNASGSTVGSNQSDVSYSSASCVSSSVNLSVGGNGITLGSGNGSINGSALELAWPTTGHDKDDPKPAYRTVLQQLGLWSDGDCYTHGASCDRFVASVILYSGVDPNFPKDANASGQLSYMSNSNLYEEITNTGNTSILQPGDILAKSGSNQTHGHIQIYVQKGDGSFGIASASYCDRTGEIKGAYNSSMSGYRIFRFIGQSV